MTSPPRYGLVITACEGERGGAEGGAHVTKRILQDWYVLRAR